MMSLCYSHRREIQALTKHLVKLLEGFNQDLIENADSAGGAAVRTLRRGDNMASVEVLRNYMNTLEEAERELLKDAELR